MNVSTSRNAPELRKGKTALTACNYSNAAEFLEGKLSSTSEWSALPLRGQGYLRRERGYGLRAKGDPGRTHLFEERPHPKGY